MPCVPDDDDEVARVMGDFDFHNALKQSAAGGGLVLSWAALWQQLIIQKL